MPRLDEISPVVLEKKNFKYFQYNFTIRYYLPLERVWNPLSPRMLCAMFRLNWPRGSGEKDF